MVGALPTEMRRLRELVDGMLADWGVSIRRACKVRPPDTSSNPYKSRRTDPPAIKKRIKAICATHVRFGYRRGHARSTCRKGAIQRPSEWTMAATSSRETWIYGHVGGV